MNQRIRKMMTIHKALHPRNNIDRAFVSRKRDNKVASIDNCVEASILDNYIKIATKIASNNTDNIATNRKRRKTRKTRK